MEMSMGPTGPQGGNRCPVVLSADHLDSGEMQALSQKFGLDTVFILAPQSKDADIQLRYFVPQHEMGVSGHATVAAITVAMGDGKLKSERVRGRRIPAVGRLVETSSSIRGKLGAAFRRAA